MIIRIKIRWIFFHTYDLYLYSASMSGYCWSWASPTICFTCKYANLSLGWASTSASFIFEETLTKLCFPVFINKWCLFHEVETRRIWRLATSVRSWDSGSLNAMETYWSWASPTIYFTSKYANPSLGWASTSAISIFQSNLSSYLLPCPKRFCLATLPLSAFRVYFWLEHLPNTSLTTIGRS